MVKDHRRFFLDYYYFINSKGSSHMQNSTYCGRCYTSCGALPETKKSKMDSPGGIDPTTWASWADLLPLSYLIIPLQINMLYFPLLVVEFTQFSI